MADKDNAEKQLRDILRAEYGLGDISLTFLREGGSRTYLAEGPGKYLVKVIGGAFAATARQSAAVTRYLEEQGFPVPKTIRARSGEAMPAASMGGEDRLIVLQEYIEGEEPDLTARCADVGALTGRLHSLLEGFPGRLTPRDGPFFVGRYLDFLRKKEYPRAAEYQALGESLWRRVRGQPKANCHGDLHRGNLLEARDGQIFFLDFDTACRAPAMFDVSVMCDMTDYFRLKEQDVAVTRDVYAKFLSGYTKFRALGPDEIQSFRDWVAIRHFQLQATIAELYGRDCIDHRFMDRQLTWLEWWLQTA